MSKKQSHNRFQIWKHFDDASDIEDFMKSNIIFKFSPARRRRKDLWFCKLDLPKKQSYKRLQIQGHFDVTSILIEHQAENARRQFKKHFDVASHICSDFLQFMQNHLHKFGGISKKITNICQQDQFFVIFCMIKKLSSIEITLNNLTFIRYCLSA